jgi:hypothetical protein
LFAAPLTQIARVDCERYHTTRHALTADGIVNLSERRAEEGRFF